MIDSGPKQPENRIHLFDPVGLINEKYAAYGVRPRRATSSHNNFAGTNTTIGAIGGGGGLRFTVELKAADTDSDTSSPRLWKSNSRSSPPTSPRFGSSPHHQLQSNNNRQSLTHQSHHQYPEPISPNSRTQAIARGRKELMDMIKDIPESCYELSLRDIVDHKPLPTPPPRQPPPAAVGQLSQESKKVQVVEKKFPQQEAKELATKDKKGKEKESKKKKGSKKVGKSESKKKMMKNKSVDTGGFLLKTSVFPIPFRSKKKKRSLNPAPSFKVAPKPPSKGPTKGTEKHWWVRKSRVSSESDSGGLTIESPRSSNSSSRSSSIVSRHRQNHRFLPSCCAFFNGKEIKAKK